jgi:hypothetical protein
MLLDKSVPGEEQSPKGRDREEETWRRERGKDSFKQI